MITLPDGYSNEQGARVVYKYLRDHPEELADEDFLLVAKALATAFPAKKQQGRS